MVTEAPLGTGLVVTLKVASLCPAGIVTIVSFPKAGGRRGITILATAVLLLERGMLTPPE